jgi:hypothetical protein
MSTTRIASTGMPWSGFGRTYPRRMDRPCWATCSRSSCCTTTGPRKSCRRLSFQLLTKPSTSLPRRLPITTSWRFSAGTSRICRCETGTICCARTASFRFCNGGTRCLGCCGNRYEWEALRRAPKSTRLCSPKLTHVVCRETSARLRRDE